MSPKEARIRIYAANYQELANLVRVPRLDVVHQTARREADGRYSVEGYVTREQMAALEARGYRFELLEDLTKWDPRNEVSKENRFEKELDQLKTNRGGRDAISER